MRWDIERQVKFNSFDYFEQTLMTENGFREYDLRWRLGVEINPNAFVVLGRAYGTYMLDTLKEQRVVVGHDFRSYSQDLARSLIVGLLSTGVHVIDIGLAVTPILYFAQYHFGTTAGLIVTASHNENGWTGLKLADGFSSTLGPEAVQEFKGLAKGGAFREGAGTFESTDGVFEAYLSDIVSGGLVQRQMKVIVATGNGTAGRFAPKVMRELGCDVVDLETAPDWTFPNFNPNPEDIRFLKSIAEATVAEKADLGVGIDGDGDRLGVVDNEGREVFADRLGLLMARWICPQHPGRKIVVDVKSTGLFFGDPVLQKAKADVVLWKTGHSYIKSKVSEVNAIAGFEKSGHWFFNKPFGRGYDDAILSAAHLVRMLSASDSSLAELLDRLPKSWQSPTLSPYCSDDVKYQVVEGVTEQYRRDMELGSAVAGMRIKDLVLVNGVRFAFEDNSWGLVRASSNKPSLVVVAESRKSEEHLRRIVAHIQTRLAETGQVGEYDQQLAK